MVPGLSERALHETIGVVYDSALDPTVWPTALEAICGLRGTHGVLAPLLETFLTEILFAEKLTLYEPKLLGRIGDADVRSMCARRSCRSSASARPPRRSAGRKVRGDR